MKTEWKNMLKEASYPIKGNGYVVDDYKVLEIVAQAQKERSLVHEEIIRHVMEHDGRARDPKVKELLEALIMKEL